jgi:hypothetical protein
MGDMGIEEMLSASLALAAGIRRFGSNASDHVIVLGEGSSSRRVFVSQRGFAAPHCHSMHGN